MLKNIIRGAVVAVLTVSVVAPSAVSAAPATRRTAPPPPVSQAFIACQKKMFRYFGPNKPMMNDRILRTDCIWRQQTFFNQARLLRLLSNQRNHTTFDLSQWPGLVTDGIFGPQTEKAAKAYQRAKLDEARASGHQNTVSPVDGIVGPKTWKSLTTDCITVLGVTKHAYSPTCFDVPRT